MKIAIAEQTRPATHRRAFVFCCDTAYLPFAAQAIDSLFRSAMDRSFDVCIVSLDTLTLPEVLAEYPVRLCRLDAGGALDAFATTDRFPVAAYVRLLLAHALGQEYDRICYLDADVLVVGSAIASVFELDLAGRPLGAVSDSMKWKRPGTATHDQAGAGLTGPYFNSGMLLIDCAPFVEQDVLVRCQEALPRCDLQHFQFDQTVLNIALEGNWTRLHPAWNWQWTPVRPLFELLVDVQIIHFITARKPWSDPAGRLPARYRARSRRFMQAHFPQVDVPGDDAMRTKMQMLSLFLRHAGKVPQFLRLMREHGAMGDIHATYPVSGR